MRSALNSPSDKIQPIRLMRCQPAKEPLFSLLKTVVLVNNGASTVCCSRHPLAAIVTSYFYITSSWRWFWTTPLLTADNI